AFKEIILSSKNNQIFDIVDYNKVEDLLNSKLKNRTNKFIWSIASMIKFTESVNKKDISKSLKIKLNIPKDTIAQNKKHPEIYDLTNSYVCLNKSLLFDFKTKEILFTKNSGNSYLKSFEGGFADVPSS